MSRENWKSPSPIPETNSYCQLSNIMYIWSDLNSNKIKVVVRILKTYFWQQQAVLGKGLTPPQKKKFGPEKSYQSAIN